MGEKVTMLRTQYLPQIVSLAVAVMLWMYVQNSEQIDITRRIPVHVLLPDDIGLVSRPPQEIQVRLRGARSSLRNIKPGTEHFINLKGMGIRGRKSLIVPIRADELPIQHFGIKIIDYAPKEVTVDMDVLVLRQIPVKAAIIGEMSNGGALLSQTVTPAMVQVKGAKDYLKSITHISTKPLELTTVNGPGEWKLPLDIDDQRLVLADTNAREVTVKLDVAAAKMEQKLARLPIRFISTGQIFQADGQMSAVSFVYPNSLSIEDVEKAIRLEVEVPNQTGRHVVKIHASLPEGLKLIKMQPQQLIIKVTKRSPEL